MRWSHALYGSCRYNVIKMQRGREVDYEKDEEVLNVLLEDNEIEEQDQLLEKLKKILLPDME